MTLLLGSLFIIFYLFEHIKLSLFNHFYTVETLKWNAILMFQRCKVLLLMIESPKIIIIIIESPKIIIIIIKSPKIIIIII